MTMCDIADESVLDVYFKVRHDFLQFRDIVAEEKALEAVDGVEKDVFLGLRRVARRDVANKSGQCLDGASSLKHVVNKIGLHTTSLSR